MKQAILLIVLAMVSVFCSGMSFFRSSDLYLASFEGKVIDSETKLPIEGAAVLAVYHGGSLSVGGSGYFPVDAQEALTDANGSFKIPARTVKSEKASGRAPGNIVIFKPGYGAFPNHRRSEAVGETKTWPTAEKYIVYELPKLTEKEERKANLPSRPDIPYGKMKYFVRLISEERVHLGLSELVIPKEEDQ